MLLLLTVGNEKCDGEVTFGDIICTYFWWKIGSSSEVEVGYILTSSHFAPFFTTSLTKKDKFEFQGGEELFCGIHWCAEIEGKVSWIRPVCLYLSVCCLGVMMLMYCNMLVPFKYLKTKLTIFILLFLCCCFQVAYSISLLRYSAFDAFIIVRLRLVLLCRKWKNWAIQCLYMCN